MTASVSWDSAGHRTERLHCTHVRLPTKFCASGTIMLCGDSTRLLAPPLRRCGVTSKTSTLRLIGTAASSSWPAAKSWKGGSVVDLHMLADYLFRDGALPQGWGCHVIGRPDQSVHAVAEIAVSLQPAEDGGVTFGTADMGIVTFGFAFGPLAAGPGHELRWHHSAVCLTDRSKTIQKVLALAWSEPPTPPCVWNFAGKVDLGSSGQRRPQSQ
jgi:hypothetical protein